MKSVNHITTNVKMVLSPYCYTRQQQKYFLPLKIKSILYFYQQCKTAYIIKYKNIYVNWN